MVHRITCYDCFCRRVSSLQLRHVDTIFQAANSVCYHTTLHHTAQNDKYILQISENNLSYYQARASTDHAHQPRSFQCDNGKYGATLCAKIMFSMKLCDQHKASPIVTLVYLRTTDKRTWTVISIQFYSADVSASQSLSYHYQTEKISRR